MKTLTQIQHTAGPWHAGGKDNQIIYSATGNPVANAITYYGKSTDGEQTANARLIAAGPELLEACEASLDFLEGVESCPIRTALYQQLDAAIQKATKE